MAHGHRDRPRILIFEENKDCGQIILSHINRRLRNSSVIICSSLDQVIATAASTTFDVAVVDLPSEMSDGLTVIESLRQGDPDLAIAAVAENVTESLMKQLFALGCQELLVRDNSFHRVVPQLIDSLYRRCQKQFRHSSTSPAANRPAASAQRIIRELYCEIGSPLANILDSADTILQNPAHRDPELENRIRTIQNAARQIKNSLEALAGKPVPRQNSPVGNASRTCHVSPELKSDR